MQTHGVIPIEFWSTSSVQTLSADAKLLTIYLIAGPHTNILGCFRFPIEHITMDLNWEGETIYRVLNELIQKKFLIYDKNREWICIESFLLWYPIEDSNKARIVEKLFKYVPTDVTFHNTLMSFLLRHVHHLNESFREELEATLKQLEKSK